VTIVDIFQGLPQTGYMPRTKSFKEDDQFSSSAVVKFVILLPVAQLRFAPGCCPLQSLPLVVGLENSLW
jgi:hypothetical protein